MVGATGGAAAQKLQRWDFKCAPFQRPPYVPSCPISWVRTVPGWFAVDKLKPLTTPLLFLAVLLIAMPLLGLVGSLWPAGLGSAQLRFGAIDLLSTALLRPLIGSFILVAVATQGEKTGLLGALWVLNGLAASVLFLALVVLLMDFLELRSQIPAGSRTALDLVAVRAGLCLGLALVVLAALSRFGFVSRLVVVRRSRVSTGDPLPLLAPER